jgi:hypothetical protein
MHQGAPAVVLGKTVQPLQPMPHIGREIVSVAKPWLELGLGYGCEPDGLDQHVLPRHPRIFLAILVRLCANERLVKLD